MTFFDTEDLEVYAQYKESGMKLVALMHENTTPAKAKVTKCLYYDPDYVQLNDGVFTVIKDTEYNFVARSLQQYLELNINGTIYKYVNYGNVIGNIPLKNGDEFFGYNSNASYSNSIMYAVWAESYGSSERGATLVSVLNDGNVGINRAGQDPIAKKYEYVDTNMVDNVNGMFTAKEGGKYCFDAETLNDNARLTVNGVGTWDYCHNGRITEVQIPELGKFNWSNTNTSHGNMIVGVTWKPNDTSEYTVTFSPGYGIVSESSRNVRYGIPLGTLPTCSWGNFRFAGWCTDKEGVNVVTKDTTFSKDTVLHATWYNGYPAGFWNNDKVTVVNCGFRDTIYKWEGDTKYFPDEWVNYIDRYYTYYKTGSELEMNGITIVMPSTSEVIAADHRDVHSREFYPATAYVYVDGELQGEVEIKHGENRENYICDFGKTVKGEVVSIVFSRNTYYSKAGDWYELMNANIYVPKYEVYINEILLNN